LVRGWLASGGLSPATPCSQVVSLDAQRQPVTENLPVAAPQQFGPQSERQAGQQAGEDPHGESGLWRARPQIMGERVAGQCAAEIQRHDGVTDHSRRVEALLNVDHGAGGLWLDGQAKVVSRSPCRPAGVQGRRRGVAARVERPSSAAGWQASPSRR